LKNTLLKPDVAFETAYRKTVLNQLNSVENNDIFTFSFIAWLIARLEKKTAHQVVLTPNSVLKQLTLIKVNRAKSVIRKIPPIPPPKTKKTQIL
jgi:hypothetical protein